jgi:membrane-bound hydrogenase subunit beta
MTDNEISQKVSEGLKTKVAEITNPAPRRLFLKVDKIHLVETMKFIREQLDFAHVATISGVDKGDVFEILYHMRNPFACLTVRTTTPRHDPKVPTITAVIPGAILYERELQDMFGLIIEGIPDSRPLLLSDNWPAGVYPLRKDWKFERPPEKIPGGE